MHALLQLYYDDIRPEEYTPSYAGRASRMDFLLKREKIVVEVKKARSNLRARERKILIQRSHWAIIH
jgi:DNA-binding sugar fermentation-stimulating protein